MKPVLFISFWLLTSCIIFSQAQTKTYKLSGVVVDLMSSKPLNGVNVSALSRISGKTLLRVSTDEKGNFDIKNIPEPGIRLKFSMVGYRALTIDSVAADQTSKLGFVQLEPTTIEMAEVVVKSLKPMIEIHADKQVINIDRIPGSSGSVTEVLRNSGLVEVNPSTNEISVRGEGIKLQMDGHQYDMPGDMLAQMPATMLEQVEVILAPGAKESAEGGTYILNLITKKNKVENYSGSVSLTSMTNKQDYGGLSLNYKSNKLNVFGQAYFGYNERGSGSESETYTYGSPTMYYQRALGNGYNYFRYGYVKAGFDYDFDDHNSVTMYASYNGYGYSNSTNNSNNVFSWQNVLEYNYLRDDHNAEHDNSYSIYGFYKKKFADKGHELTFDALLTIYDNPVNSGMSLDYSTFPGYPRIQNNSTAVHAKTLILKADYALPFKTDKLEAGYSFTYRTRNNDYNVQDYSYQTHNWYDSLKLSNQFEYKENINALYAAYAYKWNDFDLKLGLRGEDLNTEGNQITQQNNFSQNFLSLFPNFNFSYKISDMFQFGINAFRRVTYPQIYYVNPFLQYQGPNNYFAGNPKLAPSYTSSIAFNLSQYISLFYNKSSGIFTYATATEQDSILLASYINLSESKTYGFNLTLPYYNSPMMPIHLPSFITMLNLQFSYYYKEQMGRYLSEDLSMIDRNYTIRGNLGFKLWFDIDANVFLYYMPKTDNKLYVRSEYRYLYLSLSKTFMEKKLRVSLSVNGLFSTNRWENESIGVSYYTRNSTDMSNIHGIGIGISYRFNDFRERNDRSIDDGRDAGGKGSDSNSN